MGKIIQFNGKQNLRKNDQESSSSDASGSEKFYKCLKCGNARFNQVFVLRTVTPFENPDLQKDSLLPIPLFECSNCKKLVNVLQS